MLRGDLAVKQAQMFDGLSLDPFSSFYDGCSPAEVPLPLTMSVEVKD